MFQASEVVWLCGQRADLRNGRRRCVLRDLGNVGNVGDLGDLSDLGDLPDILSCDSLKKVRDRIRGVSGLCWAFCPSAV